MINENLFKSVVVKNGDTYETLAEYLGIAGVTLTRKVKDKYPSDFTQGEISQIKARYNLSPEEIDEIFFGVAVS